MTAFKKNQLVTYICDWDRKGTVTYRHAIVYSCGKKQMVLTDAETGEEMGRHFKPRLGTVGTEYNEQGHVVRMPGGTFPRMTDEQAELACIEIAEAVLAYERAHFARCLAGGHGDSYNASIQKNIDRLHEPRAAKYADLQAEIKAKIAAQHR